MTGLRVTTVLDPPASPAVPSRRRRPVLLVTLVVVAVLLAAAGYVAAARVRSTDLRRSYLGANGWPTIGQAAYRVGTVVHASAAQDPVPIASLAKVMTAYVVLQSMPLRGRDEGPSLTITARDVQDYVLRRSRDESVVRVAAGERLTERQALAALLIPSANNVAVLLARRVAGSTAEFVARMNAAASRLGMAQTRYVDPSGFDPRTVSTARDQLTLATAVAGNAVISDLVSRTSYRLPVAGVVRNTDILLGREGFVGTKTGSDDAAGGCFMFRTTRVVHRQLTEVLGVVLGQRGRHDITAGLTAAHQLAAHIGSPAGG
ncbi:D-alanyl-D-alanine carboxypeptidase family protein [uncultured Jatrophihabitans sp.]|uniref:D-alanyl-D-alanine carboxypeptidase family protein n=1 Tax=uncultured Jatrophihabitans sp. TaxID=1610747 RepID=UPI0035CC8BDB